MKRLRLKHLFRAANLFNLRVYSFTGDLPLLHSFERGLLFYNIDRFQNVAVVTCFVGFLALIRRRTYRPSSSTRCQLPICWSKGELADRFLTWMVRGLCEVVSLHFESANRSPCQNLTKSLARFKMYPWSVEESELTLKVTSHRRRMRVNTHKNPNLTRVYSA